MRSLIRELLSALLLLALAGALACERPGEELASEPEQDEVWRPEPAEPEQIGRTLGRSLESGVLRVLILPRSERYLPRKGPSTLRERDLVEAFASDLGLEIQYVNVSALAELIPALLEGRGDLIATNFTNTPARSKQVMFSSPVEVVREQLITRADDDSLSRRMDLVGRRIAVLRGSAHWSTALSLAEQAPGIEIESVPAAAVTEDLLQGVETGRYDVGMVDSNLMAAARSWHPKLRVAFDVGETRMIAWAMRPEDTELRKAADRFLSRNQRELEDGDTFSDDLAAIVKRGRLRVLTRNASTTYFVWRGELVGFEYELARRFAKQHGLRIEMIVPPRREDLLPWLKAGKGDLVAAGLTASEARATAESVRFSTPYRHVAETVVTRADDAELLRKADMDGRTFVVRRSSAYWQTLASLRGQGVPIALEAAPEEYETEEIIARVASGEYDLTLADSHLVDVEMALRDDVREAFTLGPDRPLGWALRPGNPELLAAVNEFLREEYRGSLFYNLTARKYFGPPGAIRHLAGVRAERSGRISPWDDLVRKYATQYGFDWRLVVAQMHQESRFDPNAESFAGARGLLQVMPRTAQQMGLEDLLDPEIGIHAGVRYLSWVRDRFEADLPPGQRTWFALAAYNAGPGHVRDARKLARARGLDPDRWFENVEKAMLLKQRPEIHATTRFGYCNGEEPVRYVRAISDRYDAYVQIAAADRPPKRLASAETARDELRQAGTSPLAGLLALRR